MKILLALIAISYSLVSFAKSEVTLTKTYEDRVWGTTEIYVLPNSKLNSKTRYWLNKASIAEYVIPQFDLLDDNRWSHDQFLKTDSCWFTEFASSYDDSIKTIALQAGSKFYLAEKPFIKRYSDYDDLDRLHFTLQATYWGNSSEIRGRQLHVACKVNLNTIPADNIASYIEELISPSFRTKK